MDGGAPASEPFSKIAADTASAKDTDFHGETSSSAFQLGS
jgi:hypothetical protein